MPSFRPQVSVNLTNSEKCLFIIYKTEFNVIRWLCACIDRSRDFKCVVMQDFKLQCFSRCFEASPVCLQTVECFLKSSIAWKKITDTWEEDLRLFILFFFPLLETNPPTFCVTEHLGMFCFVRAIFNKRKQIANCLPLLLAFLGKIGFLFVFNDIKISIHITRVHNASLEKTGQLWTLGVF